MKKQPEKAKTQGIKDLKPVKAVKGGVFHMPEATQPIIPTKPAKRTGPLGPDPV